MNRSHAALAVATLGASTLALGACSAARASKTQAPSQGAVAAAPARTLELNCKNVHAKGADKALKRSAYASSLAFSFQLKQLRLAVKTFHKDAYRDDMTIEQANELGEEVGFSTIKALDGKTYQGVNVGFGGGNSALYLFKRDTLELAPVVVIDGVECVELGKEN